MLAGDRRLRRNCERILGSLTIPEPFSARALVESVARDSGRRIELMPVTAQDTVPCGLLVATREADYIFYAADTTGLHQEHILLHELAHLLCGHTETSVLADSAAEILLPNLPVELVQRVLGRTVYGRAEEREAELLASLILHRARYEGDAEPRPASDDGLARLAAVFDEPRRGPGRRTPR